jgi:hypothetical protein
MSTWRFITSTVIEHESGFKLELESGSWYDPNELNPVIPDNMLVRDAALLLREGLLFASRNCKTRPSKKTTDSTSNPSEYTLRLRKK